MFAYLPEYRTKEYGKMPVFHTLQCGVRKQYSGFVFSPRMPVDVWSKDEGKMHRGVSLRMCQHCRREHSKALFGGFGELPWYEYVIKVAREGRKVMSSGYIDLWRQLSEAVREKAGWTCQQCKTKLPPPDKGVYLEVHHRDGNKSNNAEGNLVALCVRCHANVDDHHRKNYSQGPNYLKLKRYEENH